MANNINITDTKNSITITPQSNTNLGVSSTTTPITITQGTTSTVTVSTPGPMSADVKTKLNAENVHSGSAIVLTTITASGDISASNDIVSDNAIFSGQISTSKTGSLTDPAIRIGPSSGNVVGNNCGIILEELIPGTGVFAPFLVSDGLKKIGFGGATMTMESPLNMNNNKLTLGGGDDSPSLRVSGSHGVGFGEDLILAADHHIILSPNGFGSGESYGFGLGTAGDVIIGNENLALLNTKLRHLKINNGDAYITGSVKSTSTGSFEHLKLNYDNMPTSDPNIKGVIYRSSSAGIDNLLFISTG